MKSWKLIVIPFLLVILAVGAALAINVWSAGRVVPGKLAPIEVRMQGVADWAKAEQGLDLLGEYTFVTTPEITRSRSKNCMPISCRTARCSGNSSIVRSRKDKR